MSSAYYVVKTLNRLKQSDYYGNWSITPIYFNYQTIFLGVRMFCLPIIRVRVEIEV